MAHWVRMCGHALCLVRCCQSFVGSALLIRQPEMRTVQHDVASFLGCGAGPSSLLYFVASRRWLRSVAVPPWLAAQSPPSLLASIVLSFIFSWVLTNGRRTAVLNVHALAGWPAALCIIAYVYLCLCAFLMAFTAERAGGHDIGRASQFAAADLRRPHSQGHRHPASPRSTIGVVQKDYEGRALEGRERKKERKGE